MPAYTPPDKVRSPKSRWMLSEVLEDLGEWGTSVAVGEWDEKRVLAIRWNGDADNPNGNPQSRGLPIWFILPEGDKTLAILGTLDAAKQQLGRTLLRLPLE
jgi:hypothetical protein